MEILNTDAPNPKPPMSRATALGLVLSVVSCFAFRSEQPIDEYQVKAAFLFNFARFVTWPAGSFASPNDPLVICVAGPGRFGHGLEDSVKGKAIEGRVLAVRYISNAGEASSCHILFIGSEEEKDWLGGLGKMRKPGILTVGESSAAGAAGVIINFRLEDSKVRFEINAGIADRESLQISSRLLSLARTVRR
jgi:hypothetical protein